MAAIENDKDWALPVVTEVRRGVLRVDDAGSRVALTLLASDKDIEGLQNGRRCGATSCTATGQGDAIGITVLHLASHQREVGDEPQAGEANPIIEEIGRSSIPAAQI